MRKVHGDINFITYVLSYVCVLVRIHLTNRWKSILQIYIKTARSDENIFELSITCNKSTVICDLKAHILSSFEIPMPFRIFLDVMSVFAHIHIFLYDSYTNLLSLNLFGGIVVYAYTHHIYYIYTSLYPQYHLIVHYYYLTLSTLYCSGYMQLIGISSTELNHSTSLTVARDEVWSHIIIVLYSSL